MSALVLLHFSLWLVQITSAFFSTNQIKKLNQYWFGLSRSVPRFMLAACLYWISCHRLMMMSTFALICRCDCYGIGFRNSFENCFNVNWPRLRDSKADVSTQRALCQSQSGNYRSRVVYVQKDGTTLLVRRYLHGKHKIKLIEFLLKFWWKIDFCSRVFRLSVLPWC